MRAIFFSQLPFPYIKGDMVSMRIV